MGKNNFFDVKVWIKKYYNLNRNDKTFDNTNNSLEFIWVWSIFEHTYLKNSSDNKKSYNQQLVYISENFPINKINIDDIYGFLYNRYMQKGKTTRFFDNLNLKNGWKKNIKDILLKNNPSLEEKLKFVLLIIYKFRCNLFHGHKDPLLWRNFDTVFYHLNKFLASFLNTRWKLN